MMRIKIVKFSIWLMFALLILGVLNLELVRGRFYSRLSDKNCIRLLPQNGARGKILDRNGDIIVDNKLSYDVLVLPESLSGQVEVSLRKISAVLMIPAGELKSKFNSGYLSSSLPVTVAKNIDVKKAIALEELKTELPGIIIQQNPLRDYPHGNLASHVIGYVGEIDRWRLTRLADYGYKTKDIVGFGGVEEKYDYYLREEEGGLSFEVDHRGRFMRTLGYRAGQQGKNIQLTLDLKIQKIAEDSLAGKKGCVVILNPYNGEVVAMASAPDFDPAVFTGKRSSSVIRIFDDPDSPLLNRAISGAYPPGSVFKVIVSYAGLDTGKINLSTNFLCEGGILVGKKKFNCWSTHGRQNLIAAIAHSCNVFFYHAGLMLGANAIHDYAVKFGLSKSTSFELPYEASGLIPSPLARKINTFKNWFDGDTANLSIGQGDCLVTPLQMARVTAVFANKGYLVTPYVVKAIDGKDISSQQQRISDLKLNGQALNHIRRGMREVVSDPEGTANILASLPVTSAGKTGTAQAPPGQPHAWFVGFFPFENPEFVICVFLEHGGPGYYSSVLAKEIIGQMAKDGLI